MSLGLGMGLGLKRRRLAGGGGSGGTGTPLAASTLTRTTGPTEYPASIDFTRPIEWMDGDWAVMQRSQDATFGTGVTDVVNEMFAATLSYNFGVGAPVSGSWFFRMGAWRGAVGDQPADGDMIWSNVTNVGDVTAPTITSSATLSAMSNPHTADEPVTWSIVGGTDAASWEFNGADLDHVATAATQSVHDVQVRATDYAGNTDDQTNTITLDITPTLTTGTFTDVTGAALSSSHPFSYTVAGLGTGVIVNFTSTVAVTKNGSGSFTSGTCANGDILAGSVTASGTGATATSSSLTVGAGSDTFSVTTTGFTPADLWLASESGDYWDVNDLATMWQDTAGTTPAVVGQQVRRWVGKKNGTVLTPLITNGPFLQNDGTNYYLDFDQAGSAARALVVASLQTVSASTGEWTAFAAVRQPSTTAIASMTTDNGGSHRAVLMQSDTDAKARGNGSGLVTDSAGGTVVANTAFTHIGVRTATNVEAFYNNTGNGSTAVAGTAVKTIGPFGFGSSNPTGTGVALHSYRLYGAPGIIGRAINSTERGDLHTYLDARS